MSYRAALYLLSPIPLTSDVLGIEPRASHTLVKCSSTEVLPWLSNASHVYSRRESTPKVNRVTCLCSLLSLMVQIPRVTVGGLVLICSLASGSFRGWNLARGSLLLGAHPLQRLHLVPAPCPGPFLPTLR